MQPPSDYQEKHSLITHLTSPCTGNPLKYDDGCELSELLFPCFLVQDVRARSVCLASSVSPILVFLGVYHRESCLHSVRSECHPVRHLPSPPFFHQAEKLRLVTFRFHRIFLLQPPFVLGFDCWGRSSFSTSDAGRISSSPSQPSFRFCVLHICQTGPSSTLSVSRCNSLGTSP